MTFIAVRCPHYHIEQIVKCGKTRIGTQRYLVGTNLFESLLRGCLGPRLVVS
jgi:hypothetical protein